MVETAGIFCKTDDKHTTNQSVHQYHIFRPTHPLALNFHEGCTPRLSKTPLMLVPSWQSNSKQCNMAKAGAVKSRLLTWQTREEYGTPINNSPSGMVCKVHTIHSEQVTGDVLLMVWGLPHQSHALRQRPESDECQDCSAARCSWWFQAIPNKVGRCGQSILDHRPK